MISEHSHGDMVGTFLVIVLIKSSHFFVRERRYTIEGALCVDGLLAYGLQEGPMTSQDYQHFIETVLVCILLIMLFCKI